MRVRKYQEDDLSRLIAIWNEVVEEGIVFPQEELLDLKTGAEFLAAQSYTGATVDDYERVADLHILHQNNIGRCGPLGNAICAVSAECRGQHIGEVLVKDSLRMAKALGFKVLQFNAVVESNVHVRHLYERVGFVPFGIIPKGFRMKDGHYENICPYYYDLGCL